MPPPVWTVPPGQCSTGPVKWNDSLPLRAMSALSIFAAPVCRSYSARIAEWTAIFLSKNAFAQVVLTMVQFPVCAIRHTR